MAISRFQMNRQLRAYGGIMGQDGRRNYGIGSFFQKYIKDPVEMALTGKTKQDLEDESQARVNEREKLFGKGNTQPVSNFFKDMFLGKETPIDPDTGKPVITPGTTQRQGGILGSLLSSRVALPLASGLLAGAFTKDKEDPIYTGQDVGLNLQDIGRLANITDPKAGQAMGLRFLPDVESRKFTPEEMAASYAANAPQDFTEKREQAQDGGIIKEAEKYATQKESEFLRSVDINNIPRTGNLQREQERAYENAYKEYMGRNKKADGGIMGDQKDFEEFLQDMQDRDKSMLQDRIMEDFEKFMKRKRMIENLPEAKNGGIMKMAEGGMMDMGGMEMDLRGGGFVPMGRAEKADDVPARLSKNEFVFTADAVRAAGGGNVDKGADKMYATMKKLEDRVA